MAIVEKQIAQAVGTTSAVSVYSPPSGVRTIIKTIVVANTTNTVKQYSIFHDDNGTTYDETTALVFEIDVAKESVFVLDAFLASNNSGANFAVKASAANSITFTFYGAELT